MKRLNILSLLVLLTFCNVSIAQTTISRQVIGSTGNYSVGTSITLTSTVGEVAVQTLFSVNGIIDLTQGFQQPEREGDSAVVYEVINESCPGAKNGSIYISEVLGCPGPYSVDVSLVGDTVNVLGTDTLGTGMYNVTIYGINNCSYTTQIFVGLDSDEDCTLKFYTGVTPNGDGKNDVWIIENIEQFPDNEIRIFNRWGEQVWKGEGYDNSTVVWPGNSGGSINSGSGEEFLTATYFYVADVGGKIYKGWVELTR